ncbi:MAG: inositol monophosphatase family protein [Patescibacteria group bacterium]
MSNTNELQQFFHEIATQILDFTKKHRNNNAVVLQKINTKDSVDFATETDVAVEKFIIHAIKNQFPNDEILSEEENASTATETSKRLWIIDPICGTSNFARGLPLYVSNIALAEMGEIVASCVVDHLFGKYFWSVGDGIFENMEPLHVEKRGPGTKVEVDLGALISAPQEVKDRHAKFIERFLRETDICCLSLNTSQSFLFVAEGIYDGFVTPWIHAWDIAAPVFLIKQAGGVITDIDGNPWNLSSPNAVSARDPKLHERLLSYLHQ